MKKTASEIIKNLESRIARLEKKAGPGAGVELCLSGESRNVRCLDTEIDDSRLKVTVDRDGYPVFKGFATIENLTIASYYNAKNIYGVAAKILGKDLTGELDSNIIDLVDRESDQELSDVDSYNITNIALENSIEGGGYSRGEASDYIDISGEIEIEIEFKNGDYILDVIEFECTADTTQSFKDNWNNLDDPDYED
tara:strand:+ start:1423 stop:2010 length:588 start_codon:yes stop_codon:yes gene_type:complete